MLEIPDSVLREAKATAARRGETLKKFVTQAIREKLENSRSAHSGDRAWMDYFGAFGKTRQMRAETRRIQRIVDEEFESLDSGRT